jgi:putative peptide zinc metalloprotease protein
MAALSSESELAQVEEAWQGIAGLKLRPCPAVNFYQHHYRGEPWLIIADEQNESYFRCSNDAGHFLALLDGATSVEQALDETRQALSSGLQQQDIVMLVANLKAAGLLQDDAAANDDSTRAAPKPKSNRWLSPFAIKFPLFDPDRLLQKTAALYQPLFSPAALLIWTLMLMLGLATALLNWQALADHSAARFADPQNLLWYWLLYPLVKGLHEFGHACATRRWGGPVHEMGIMLLVFFPVPYVDSSAAHRFGSKRQRITVCAAGIMVEVLLASLALLVWANTEHGLVHDLAFDIVVIGGVSTLLFNANPLLRFDGYYLLGELIEIPNLGTRSDQYLAYLFKHHVLGLPGMRSPVTAAGEIKWLVTYGICSRIYRVLITLIIALWAAGKFLIIGVLLALWAVAGQIVYPLVRSIARLIPQVLSARRIIRLLVVLSLVSALMLAILTIPVGHSTYSEGVVGLPENALIRAGADGIVTRVLAADGAAVTRGEVILQLENLELEAKRDGLLARLEETRARQQQAFLQDRSQADILRIKVSALEADIKDAQEQLESLKVLSATDGLVSLPTANDLPGRYVSRGDVIGYVAGPGQASALVVIPQLDIDTVRRDMQAIEVRMSSRPAETLDAAFLRELPLGTDRLPNRMLGSAGQVVLDTRDASGMQLLSNIFLVEIALPLRMSGNYLGQRIYVRFVHQSESLGNRLLRRLDQVMLQAPFV